jgi:PAS domain S-box-containing protein
MTDKTGWQPFSRIEPQVPRPPSARGLWALGFVALALIALVAVPSYFGYRVAAVQGMIINVGEPATRLSAKLGLLKARQMARVEGFLLSRDGSFREYYRAAIVEEDAVLDSLAVFARELDQDVLGELQSDSSPAPIYLDRTVFERVAALSSESFDWRFNNIQLFEQGPTEDARAQLRQGYEDLQRATRDLDLIIAQHVSASRSRVVTEQRLQARIMLALAFVALLATLIVGRVAYRYRALTVERETRRRVAVQQRREADALLEATDDGVLGMDLGGRCVSLNRAGARLLGYTVSEIRGRDVHATIFHSDREGRAEDRSSSSLLSAAAKGKALESGDGAVLWHRRGIPFPARWSLLPMIDGKDLIGAVLTFADMTETFEREAELRRAVRQREDVVSIVSHDLQNPLSVTIAAAEILLDLSLDEQERRRQAEMIHRSGKRMQGLIGDLLDASRIEAGIFVVRPSKEDLVMLLDEAVSLFEMRASSRSINLSVENTGPVVARVDRDRVIQAVSNLLDNAIRLTPEGGSVTASSTYDGSWVRVSVTDSGPGVAPDVGGRIFDRFSQGGKRDGGSAGLGLAIVKGVASAHGGSAEVDSTLGKGSTFTLKLPVDGPVTEGEQVADDLN